MKALLERALGRGVEQDSAVTAGSGPAFPRSGQRHLPQVIIALSLLILLRTQDLQASLDGDLGGRMVRSAQERISPQGDACEPGRGVLTRPQACCGAF